MSGYRITLNLAGNASAKVDKLALGLERADVAASSLARSLASVAAASHAINRTPIPRIPAPTRAGRERIVRPPVAPRAGRERIVRPPVAPREPNYTRHKHTRVGSFGVGGSFGMFSGRLSTIIQPDANGNLLGMNAERLMKGVNITAIVGSLLTKVGTFALKAVAAATVAPLVIGGGVLMTAMRALQSEGFAGGVRLIARRHQAKSGLGEDFERANMSADFISKSYGFDRSTALSSINVLTGLGVGGTDRKLNVAEATGLTKVGGLISQQSGVSFERVMTNIQQLLVQTTPHVRDIREMLNQAPILGKYAIKDMEEKGVKGVTTFQWLKDQNNLMSVLKRYEVDMASNAGMRARGEIAVAEQEAWKTIASNNEAWEYVGYSGAKMIKTFADSINTLLSAFTSNPAFLVMVERINVALESIGKNAPSWIDQANTYVEQFAQQYGIPLGDEKEPRRRVEKQLALAEVLNTPNSYVKKDIIDYAEKGGYFKYVPKTVKSEAENQLMSLVFGAARSDSTLVSKINGVGELEHAGAFDSEFRVAMRNSGKAFNLFRNGTGQLGDSVYRYRNLADYGMAPKNQSRLANPTQQYAAVDIKTPDVLNFAKTFIDSMLKSGKVPTDIKTGGAETGSDLTGFNKDRRALEIHFNAPIVEWTNTMETTSPQETVDAVAENLEVLASAAIQKALLGASNKMSSRWY